jgi:membrane protein involved in D-alanine export
LTPYVGFAYFALLLYPVVPALLLGFTGRLRPWFLLAASVGMLWLQVASPLGPGRSPQLPFLAAWTLYAAVVVLAFAALRRRGPRRGLYYAAVALTLLPLAAVKAYPLLAGIGPVLRHTPGPRTALLVPGLVDTFGFLGISYMTFRVLDAVICLQDGLVGGIGLGELLNYVLFFPCASAGPIDRYRRFQADLGRPPTPAQYAADVDAALYRIAQGFLYKFLLAQLIYSHWLVPAGSSRDFGHMLSYMYAYTFYLFFDFAGYSAFAIGVGRLFGIRTPENFRAPFLSRNFREFWNRWFITLSWFLRDHVYMRFVLAATRRRWFRNRYTASYLGYLLTMGLMGLWHGLQANYIVYGLYQGVMLIVYDFLGRWNRRRRLLPDNAFTRGVSIFITFQLVAFGMLIFSGHLFL